jgi:hypothetical protein
MSAVSGRYFVDRNQNHQESSNEAGVAGARVHLVKGSQVVASTTTANDGKYMFTNVDAGFYTVRFDATSLGSNFVKANVGNDYIDSDVWTKYANGTGVTGSFYVAKSKHVSNIDAGITTSGGQNSAVQAVSSGSGSVAGRYFQDKNKSGYEDGGDSGVTGATVRLMQGDRVVASTKTDGNGNYKFSGLDAGNYRVEFQAISSAYNFTKSNVGGASKNAVDSDVWTTGSGPGMTGHFYVGNGNAVRDIDAGVVTGTTTATPVPLTTGGSGSVAGRYFRDNNNTNREDGGDSGVSGGTVRLLQGDKVVATTKTDGNGNYKFSNVQDGGYVVEFMSAGSNMTFSRGNVGTNNAIDSDVWRTDSNGNGKTGYVEIKGGNAVYNMDAGVVTESTTTQTTTTTPTTASNGSIAGRYFRDNNNSNREDGGDTGVAGSTVSLVQGGKVVATTKTDGNGNYKFSNVENGSYTVEFQSFSSDYTYSRANIGSNDAIDSDVWTTKGAGVGVTSGVTVNNNAITNIDAGAVKGYTSEPAIITPTNTNPNPNPTPVPVSQSGDDLSVLFIGNSYTYFAPKGNANYSVAAQFESMAQAAGYDVTYDGSFIGGVTLGTHWGKSGPDSARGKIQANDYDLVVLQDATWSAGAVDAQVTNFSNLAKANGSDVLVTSMWAGDWVISYNGGDSWADAVDYANETTAIKNDIAYSPAGRAYTAAHRYLTEKYGNGDNGLRAEDMLTEDAIHATELGAYLAANVIYATAFGTKAPAPNQYLPANVSYADAAKMQDLAWSAVNQYGIFSDGDWLG